MCAHTIVLHASHWIAAKWMYWCWLLMLMYGVCLLVYVSVCFPHVMVLCVGSVLFSRLIPALRHSYCRTEWTRKRKIERAKNAHLYRDCHTRTIIWTIDPVCWWCSACLEAAYMTFNALFLSAYSVPISLILSLCLSHCKMLASCAHKCTTPNKHTFTRTERGTYVTSQDCECIAYQTNR